MSANDNWLTPKQVAGMCCSSQPFLTRRRQRRQPPPFYRLGGKILYDKTEVEEWIASCRHDPHA